MSELSHHRVKIRKLRKVKIKIKKRKSSSGLALPSAAQ